MKPFAKFFWISIFLLLSGCLSNKNLIYLRDNNFEYNTATQIANINPPYTLQIADIINVRIKTLDTESSSYFNLLSEQNVFNFNSAGLYLNSHSIDNDGTIEMPEVGKIKVAGLTLSETQQHIQKLLDTYLRNATVIVKLVSFKIAVLGEVRNPGYYYIYNEGASLLEAIALAGDLNDFGNRENITLIRETEAGSEAVLVNLKKTDFLNSPFYYLKPNDVIYVQPLKAKTAKNNLSTLATLGILFSGISATVLLLQYINPK